MLQKLKIYSAKRALKKRGAKSFASQGEAVKVVMLVDIDSVGEGFDVINFRKELGISYEDFDFLIYSKKKQIDEKYSLDHFGVNNLGWKANFVEGSKERNFQETKYKIIVNYFVSPPPELWVLSASVQADLRIGFPMENGSMNHIEINVDSKDYQLFTQELKKYLGTITN